MAARHRGMIHGFNASTQVLAPDVDPLAIDLRKQQVAVVTTNFVREDSHNRGSFSDALTSARQRQEPCDPGGGRVEGRVGAHSYLSPTSPLPPLDGAELR